MIPTDEQRAILHEIRHGKDHVRIDALAGCTKTTTLIEGLKVIPQRSILFAAFGKGIETEARARVPRLPGGWLVVVQTFHALGREILLKHHPRLKIDRAATEELVNAACAGVFPGAPYEVRRAAMRIVRFAKEALAPRGAPNVAWPAAELVRVGYEHNLIGPKLKPPVVDRLIDVVRRAIVDGADVARRTTVDFCDLVWLPNVLDLAPPARYQAIMLDEVQDISAPQVALIRRVMLPTTRVIAVGDRHQQIFKWRGSLGGDAFEAFAPKSGQSFPLTMTRRCAKAIVREAQQLVPALRAPEDAEEGSVTTCALGDLPSRLAQGYSDEVHTFILSRDNQTLLDCALFLWRARTRFMLIAGQDLLDPLFHLLDHELDVRDDARFRASLDAWHARAAAHADQVGATSRRERIDEHRAMLLAALRYAPPNRLKTLLAAILRDDKSGVRLMTVHKAKGLEAERVFLLRQTFARHRDVASIGLLADFEEPRPPTDEELNIEYVAITRAKTHLVWVDLRRRGQSAWLTMPIEEIPEAELEDAAVLHERAFQQAELAGGDQDVAATALAERLQHILQRMRF